MFVPISQIADLFGWWNPFPSRLVPGVPRHRLLAVVGWLLNPPIAPQVPTDGSELAASAQLPPV